MASVLAGAVRPEAACGEPDDVGVYRDLDDGVARAVVLPARVPPSAEFVMLVRLYGDHPGWWSAQMFRCSVGSAPPEDGT
jgi:hypothetical protein